MISHQKRAVWTLIILVVLTLIFIPASRNLLFEKSVFSFVDKKATEYVDDGLVRATAAFVMARSFNAIVSVFQESELQLEPGGVGVSLALGQALDPVNDLVERFSWVMLASLTSLGIQKVLIEITPFVSVQIVLVLALLALLIGVWMPSTIRYDFSQLGRVLLLCAILLRFAVPAMSYLNQQVYVAFLENRHDQSVEVLGETVKKLEAEEFNESVATPLENQGGNQPTKENGWLDRQKNVIGGFFDQGKKILDVKVKIEAIKKAALELVDRLVDLIVVFVLSTIALPLLFLWGILKLGRLVIGQGFSGMLPKLRE